MGLFSAETWVVSNGRTAIHIPLTNRWKKPHQRREHGAGVEDLSDKRRKTMKKLMLITLALIALTISVPAAMARDANRDALRQEGKAITAQQKQQEARFNAINVEAAKLLQTLGAKAEAS
jgi:hypothetical protein